MHRYDLACFDMDGTLTKVRSSWKWVHDCFGVDSEPNYRAFVNGEIDEKEFMRRDIALWKDRKPDINIRDIARTFRDMPLIDGIQETVACLQDNGIACVIVSGGIDLAAKMLKDEFGFDGYVADSLEAGPDGTLTGEGIQHVDLRDKGIQVKEIMKEYYTRPERTISIGNSYTDIPMFKCTGLSIALNPADPWTKEAATHWIETDNISDILDFIIGDAPEERRPPVSTRILISRLPYGRTG